MEKRDIILSILWGMLLGVMHGIVLMGAREGLGFISYMRYQDINTLPVQVVLIIDCVILVVISTAPLWINKVEQKAWEIANASKEEAEDEVL